MRDLELVADALQAVLGLGLVEVDARVRAPLLDDRLHPLLDLGEVLLHDLARGLEVVVEALVGRGAEAQVGAWEELHDGHGEQVCSAEAQDVERVLVAGGHDAERTALLDRPVDLDDVALDLAGHGRLREARPDLLRHLTHRRPGSDLADRSIG